MGSKKPKVEIVEYFMSIHFGICAGPVDELRRIFVAEKEAFSGSLTDVTSIAINNPDLFGGVKKEGGIVGNVHYLPGRSDQIIPDVLAGKMGLTSQTCPGYRGIASIFFHNGRLLDLSGLLAQYYAPGGPASLGLPFTVPQASYKGFYWSANQPYLRGVWTTASRTPRGLNPTLARVVIHPNGDYDVNPSHIIYECLTNTDWGMGAPSTSIDVSSFEAAAQTLFDEGLGLSLLWAQQSTIEEFVSIIINHIEAALFINPRTGLFTLKLIRDDYDIDDLPIISPDNAELSNFQRKLWAETTNEIVVSWKNPETEQTETVSAQDLANIAMQGGVNSDSRNYEGVRTADLAMQLAMRDLAVVSQPLIACEALTNRKGWNVFPGSVVALNWPEHGVERVAMRVGPVDYGRTTDSKIRLSLVEDVFGRPKGQFTPRPATAWVPTGETPAPIAHSLIFTAPYYSIVNSGADVDSIAAPNVVPAILAAQTGTDTSAVRLNADDEDSFELNIISRANTLAALTFEEVSVVPVTPPSRGRGFAVGSLAIIGTTDENMEICEITATSLTSVTLKRGVLDTTPKVWPSGVAIWFVSADEIFMPEELFAAETPASYKLRSVTSLGVLSVASAGTASAIMSERPHLPFRPANVRVNGQAFGTFEAVGLTSLSVTWARRDRLSEDTVMLAWEDADVTPEAGQTTTVAVYSVEGDLITSHDDIAGTSFTLPITSFGAYSRGIVKVTSKLGGKESLQGHGIEVVVGEGYGYSYGYNYGGL